MLRSCSCVPNHMQDTAEGGVISKGAKLSHTYLTSVWKSTLLVCSIALLCNIELVSGCNHSRQCLSSCRIQGQLHLWRKLQMHSVAAAQNAATVYSCCYIAHLLAHHQANQANSTWKPLCRCFCIAWFDTMQLCQLAGTYLGKDHPAPHVSQAITMNTRPHMK